MGSRDAFPGAGGWAAVTPSPAQEDGRRRSLFHQRAEKVATEEAEGEGAAVVVGTLAAGCVT